MYAGYTYTCRICMYAGHHPAGHGVVCQDTGVGSTQRTGSTCQIMYAGGLYTHAWICTPDMYSTRTQLARLSRIQSLASSKSGVVCLSPPPPHTHTLPPTHLHTTRTQTQADKPRRELSLPYPQDCSSINSNVASRCSPRRIKDTLAWRSHNPRNAPGMHQEPRHEWGHEAGMQQECTGIPCMQPWNALGTHTCMHNGRHQEYTRNPHLQQWNAP